MTERPQLNFRIDKELLDGLHTMSEDDPEHGVSYHVRQAIRQYLERNGVKVKTERKKAGKKKT